MRWSSFGVNWRAGDRSGKLSGSGRRRDRWERLEVIDGRGSDEAEHGSVMTLKLVYRGGGERGSSGMPGMGTLLRSMSMAMSRERETATERGCCCERRPPN